MPSAPLSTILDNDVYVLTARGATQIRGTATALSPAEIELLVCLDGLNSVGDIKKLRLSMPAAEVDAVLAKLRARNLVELFTDRADKPLDISALLDSTGSFRISDGELKLVDGEAASGVASLQKSGYYVRIARRATQRRERPRGHKLSALIIEDEPLLAKFLRTYLLLEDFEARIATNREQIVAEFRKPPIPDLVLLDVVLPDADGFNILQKIREHPQLRSVPIIMITAQATREAVLKGLAGGADGYMTKPFEVENLIAAIRAVLGLEAPE
ncbi:MAG TPA: response regulator [Burkholderiales bacterium]|nr:response regulator [Burkholderiales bacterium]